MAAVHRDRYRQTLAGLPREPLPALGPALSLAAMADALLQEIAKEEYRVLHQRIGLTPLTKLWISWRWHRRARRPRGW
jgi:phytoene synthase